MTRSEFVTRHRIEDELARRGVKVIGSGVERKAKCPFHSDGKPSLSINTRDNVWKCHAGCGSGGVIDLLAKFDGISAVEFLKREQISSDTQNKPFTLFKPNRDKATVSIVARLEPEKPKQHSVIEKTYSYTDALGQELYQTVRLKPKDFRQRRSENGEWVWSMNGVQRVLYHLPQLLKAKTVWLTEGERDVETLESLGFAATTSVGGCKGWLDGYADSLNGKEVVLCGDNDDPGREYMRRIFDSMVGKASTVKMIDLPGGVKDVSDFVGTFKELPQATKALKSMCELAYPHINGFKLPIYGIAELESRYRQYVDTLDANEFNLSKWIPTLGKSVRSLVPGEMVLLIGDTGSGKTCILSGLATAALPLPTLLFELELPAELLFERFVAANRKMSCSLVEASYKSGDTLGEDNLKKHFRNLFVCTEAGLSVEQIEQYIIRADLRIGQRPKVVLIDYVQLISGDGKSRYERISNAAEKLKVVAKKTQTVLILASQVHRPSDGEDEISLHSGKDSGCLARRSTLLLTACGFQESIEGKMQTCTLKTSGNIESCISKDIDQGRKKCVKIMLRSGRFLECTPDHKILTDVGWVEAGAITAGHAIAVARSVPSPNYCEKVKEARIMGWMIGDGCTLGRLPPHFTSADPVLSEEFIKEVQRVFHMTPKRRKMDPSKTHDEFYVTTGVQSPEGGNPFKNWLRAAGLWYKKAPEKRIPDWFKASADNQSIAEIVGGLVDTDGSVRLSARKRISIKFSSSSEGLVWDFLWCLARLGIVGRLQKVEPPKISFDNRKCRAMHSVIIDCGLEVLKFKSLVTLTGRKQKRLDTTCISAKGSNGSDTLGYWVWKRLAELARERGIVDRRFMMARCQDRRISHPRLVGLIDELLPNPPSDIQLLLNPNIFWDQLKYRRHIGVRSVFDRSVCRTSPNFIANGIVVHNSLENSAGLVLGMWRDSQDSTLMKIKILKNTKGSSGKIINCNFDGDQMLISERAKFSGDDIPNRKYVPPPDRRAPNSDG